MIDGDILTDSRGASWILDAPLGRGLWGRARVVRGEDGTMAVLKTPLTASDFPDRDDAAALAEACRRAAHTFADLYEAGGKPGMPPLLARVALDDAPAANGRIGLLLPRYGASLESRLAGGMPLAEAIDLVLRTLHGLATASAAEPFVHGNLRPTNILLDDDGNPVLSDRLVAPLIAHREGLEAAAGPRTPYLPPEAHGAPLPGHDTWACCATLYRACMLAGKADDPDSEPLPLPQEGLGRVALATVQDAAAGRLRAEKANPRFSSRAVRALGRILNRGLSEEPAPSPPFRFERAADLRDRLVEVDELIHPHITHVGALQPGPEAKEDVFEGGSLVSFSVNLATTRGVDAEHDLVPGVAVVDLDAAGDGRVQLTGSRFRVQSYPTGRFRFRFELVDVPPGRYEARIAIGIRDGDEPLHKVTRQFEVRPKPGYVPPPPKDDPTSEALPLRPPDEVSASGGSPVDHGWTTGERPSPLGDIVAFPESRPRTPRPVAPDEPASGRRPGALRSGGLHLAASAEAHRTSSGARAGLPSGASLSTQSGPTTSGGYQPPTAGSGPAPVRPALSASRGGHAPAESRPALASRPAVSVSVPSAAPSSASQGAPPSASAVPRVSMRSPDAAPSSTSPSAGSPTPPRPTLRAVASPASSPSGPSPAGARITPSVRPFGPSASVSTPSSPASTPSGHATAPRVRPPPPPPPLVPSTNNDPSGASGPSFDDLADDPFDEGRDLPRYEGAGYTGLSALDPTLDRIRQWVDRDPYMALFIVFLIAFLLAVTGAMLLTA